jgi:rare lipoprotein A
MNKLKTLVFLLVFTPLLSFGQDFFVGQTFKGELSFYNDNLHGKQTASGKVYDKEKISAAHKNLPFGTIVEVKNNMNEKVIFAEITDRIAQNSTRIIDLSKEAAIRLDFIKAGIVQGEVRIIQLPKTKKKALQEKAPIPKPVMVKKEMVVEKTNEANKKLSEKNQNSKLYGIQFANFTERESLNDLITDLKTRGYILNENLFIVESLDKTGKKHYKLIHGYFGYSMAKKKISSLSDQYKDIFIVPLSK